MKTFQSQYRSQQRQKWAVRILYIVVLPIVMVLAIKDYYSGLLRDQYKPVSHTVPSHLADQSPKALI